MKNTSIYIHIPFCDHKCIYCDFYSIITSDNVSSFLSSLKKEIDFYSSHYSEERNIVSVFFGGGTPSLMHPDYLNEILIHLNKYYHIDNNVEITMETNPGTVDKNKLQRFKESGINRISIGIQSFDDDELKFLTRIHNKNTAIQTVYNATETGFDNINIDLIFNLPKQTKETWINNLETAVSLPIKHISTYSLILERGTILNKMVLDGRITMQDDDYDADLYETTINFLTSKRFQQYEVSNFSLPGYECVHNNSYWNYTDYFGFGPSAHSFIDGKRWWNFSSLKKYIHEVEQNQNAVMNYEILANNEMQNEYIMLALRSSGLDLTDYKKRFGTEWLNKNYHYFKMLENDNFILNDNSKMRFTSKGYAVCDEILKNIL